MGRGRGLDFEVGDRLFGLVSRHVARIAGARFVQPMLPMGTAKRFLQLAAAELKPALMATGLGTESEAEEMLRALHAVGEDRSAYYAPGRMAQVAGVVG